MNVDDAIPAPVREAYGLDDVAAEPISVGWINRTFVARRAGERVIVQRLHPVFAGEVNLDIDAITAHLARSGLATPRLVRALDGRAWVDAGGVWRALTYLEGRTIAALDAAHARAAGALVARFHAALAGFAHEFAFARPGAHDTAAHLAKLERLAASHGAHPRAAEIAPIAEAILAHGRALPPIGELPSRIVHGDLKATNFLFEHDRPVAVALVDLDTLAHGTLAVELGDALRSWCNPSDESDPQARFDPAIFEAALLGYAEAAPGLLSHDEIESIVPGVETIAVELASRFAADVYEDRYFGYDASRFASRVDHNLARARAQLSLARSVAAQRDALSAIARRAFTGA
ncbi:MAG TPA: phosphotransferase [Sandaracinaceae bacterium]